MEAATGPVNYRIGNEKLIRVQDAASAKLRVLLERQGRAGGALARFGDWWRLFWTAAQDGSCGRTGEPRHPS